MIGPLLAEACASCHAASSPRGGYRLDSYREALSRRTDGTQRVRVGDLASPLLQAARGELPDHPPVTVAEDALRLLEAWASRCELAHSASRVHPRGFLNPGDPRFHGRTLRARGYDLTVCSGCHGDDGPGASCTGCHSSGPLDCGTCHGASGSPLFRDLAGASAPESPGAGAHAVHLTNGPLHAAYACRTCHPIPTGAEAPGHYRLRGGPDVSHADVVLPAVGDRSPWFDPATRRCSGTWCHAPSLTDTAATNPAPRWNVVGHGEASCGSCHGHPPASPHPPDSRCHVCHREAFRDGDQVAATHADGTVQVGQGCTDCHGSAENAAPPRDVHGNTRTSIPAVGAHQAHLRAGRLRGPVPCSECHATFTALKDPGHVDHEPGAVVFPALSGVGVLARAQHAAPVYDASALSCAGVYCHGNGYRLAADRAPGMDRTPTWNAGPGEAACGTCHGIPPLHAGHRSDCTLTECAECHRPSIDPEGRLVFKQDASGRPVSRHLDGTVDIGPFP